jgi:hypothetical protein
MGDSGSNRGSSNASNTVMEMFRNEYLWDSSSCSKYWSKQDTLTAKEIIQERMWIKLRSCSREADLHVRPAGMVNPRYLGTLVAVQVYNTNSCTHVLVLTKLDLTNPAKARIKKEISVNLLSNFDGAIYALSCNSLNQWILEKWR